MVGSERPVTLVISTSFTPRLYMSTMVSRSSSVTGFDSVGKVRAPLWRAAGSNPYDTAHGQKPDVRDQFYFVHSS